MSGNGKIRKVTEVPAVLLQEFSQELGQGKEREIGIQGHMYRLQELDPEKAGFSGAVGFREEHGYAEFVLWPRVPKERDSLSARPVITVTAGAYEVGEWAYGFGRKMRETAHVTFPYDGLSLEYPSMKLIPKVLQRAAELVSASRRETYWEKDRDPERDYTGLGEEYD